MTVSSCACTTSRWPRPGCIQAWVRRYGEALRPVRVGTVGHGLSDQMSAMPSMHVAWALIVGCRGGLDRHEPMAMARARARRVHRPRGHGHGQPLVARRRRRRCDRRSRDGTAVGVRGRRCTLVIVANARAGACGRGLTIRTRRGRRPAARLPRVHLRGPRGAVECVRHGTRASATPARTDEQQLGERVAASVDGEDPELGLARRGARVGALDRQVRAPASHSRDLADEKVDDDPSDNVRPFQPSSTAQTCS